MKQDSVLRQMPLWKWGLLLVGGLLLTVFIYTLASSLFWVPAGSYLLTGLFLLFSGVLIAVYCGAIKVFENRKTFEFKPSWGIIYGFVIGLLFIFLVTFILWIFGFYKVETANFAFTPFLLALAQMLMVACAEEIIFRGFLFRFVDERWGLWPALITSALIFGLLHIFNPGATLLSSIFIAIEAGLLLGIAYKCTNNLWFPIGIHWSWNLTLGPILGFPVSGENLTESIVSPIVSGPEILTGGNFGPEASIITAIYGLLIFFILLLITLKKQKTLIAK